MAQHAVIDATGKARGFFDDTLHKTIPAGAVRLTPEQYAAWLRDPFGLVWHADSAGLVAAPAAPPRVPRQVAAYALKAQLHSQPAAEAGRTLLDDASAWAQAQGGLVALAWDHAATFQRGGPFVAQLAAHLGWNPAEIDAQFVAAAKQPAP